MMAGDEFYDDDVTSGLTESQGMVIRARVEYNAMSPEERAEVDKRWAETPQWKKDELRAEVEFDLL